MVEMEVTGHITINFSFCMSLMRRLFKCLECVD